MQYDVHRNGCQCIMGFIFRVILIIYFPFICTNAKRENQINKENKKRAPNRFIARSLAFNTTPNNLTII